MGYIETLTEKIEQAKTRKEKRAYRIALALYCLSPEGREAAQEAQVLRHARHRELQAELGEATCPDQV